MKTLLPRALFFFIVPILALIFALNLFTSSKADDISTQALQTIDLSVTAPSVNFIGANEDDNLGGSGSQDTFTNLTRSRPLATGDFNKDGIQDLVVGGPNVDYTPPGVGGTNRPNTGAVYILFGRNTFAPLTLIDANIASPGQPDIQIYGASSDDNVGFAVAVGDINGDGTDDLLIGAPGVNFGSPSRPDTGAVYVMLGSSTLVPKTIDLAVANSINIVIYGEKADDKFGAALAAGNVGGATATADILIGAPGSKGPDPGTPANVRTDGGAAYVLYGGTAFTPNPPNLTAILDLAVSQANVKIFGATGSLLGSSVAIGDVNATSPGDLILGAPKANRPVGTGSTAADDTGAAYVVYGGDNLAPTPPATFKTVDITLAGQSVSIYGATTGDHLGASVAAGDVTGDGNADLAIGAPDADGPLDARLDSGEAYLISGSSSLPARINVTLTTVSLTIFGESVDDHTGSTVAVGRLNTTGNIDTLAEFLVGSPGALANRGSVSAFYGGASLTALSSRDLFLGQDDLRVLGQAAGDELGWAIVTLDLDSNRGGDLVVSAPFGTPFAAFPQARPQSGRAYILLAASDTVPPINQPPLVQVTAPNGGETLLGGSTFPITWTASDPDDDDTIQGFEIRLSIDGGTNFNTIIASNVAGTARTFNWTVNGGLNTNTARIRVMATDNAGGTAQDASNANFTITDPGILVNLLTPNGGESLKFGQTFTITWEVDAATAAQLRGFDLFLSVDGGLTFNRSIQSDPINPAIGPAVRLFNWTVPSDTCTTQARVLVVATSLTGVRSTDASAANFSITGLGPTIDTSAMDLDSANGRLVLRTIQPPIGNEIVAAPNAVLEISSTEAGTTFFTFSKSLKIKKGGRKIITKGTINDLDVSVFFPDQAIRFLRITNPPCGITLLRVRRQGDLLVLAPVGAQ
jgi:hypothetical protein